MKRLLLLVLMAVAVLTTSFAQDKRYDVERVILKKNTVMDMGAMLQTISSVQYIDDYGRKESVETFMDMMGQTFTIFTMMKDDYVYTVNMATKQGQKVNMASMVDDYKTVNYLNLTDEIKQKYQIEERGTEQFLGKECKRYELTVTVQGQSVKGYMLVWQGLPLKSSMTVAGSIITEEVTEMQEGVEIAKEKFELPEGVSFMDVTPQL